jgi:hypothetical protein
LLLEHDDEADDAKAQVGRPGTEGHEENLARLSAAPPNVM